jgi:hypothetical protein
MNRTVRIIMLLLVTGIGFQGYSQVVNDAAKKKISVGVGLFTDILVKFPSDLKPRTINQGFTVFGTYNVPFGKSNFSFAIGLAITSHNIFGNYTVEKHGDSTLMVKIPDSVNYNRSKINATYIEIPIEFRFKSKSKVSVGIGFKGGFLVGSSSKYVGEGGVRTPTCDLITTKDKISMKFWSVKNLETFTYGPTLRIGYKWANLYASYMLSSIFSSGNAPEVIPLSVGFVLMPF